MKRFLGYLSPQELAKSSNPHYRANLAWIWTYLLSRKRQATDFVETVAGQAANDSQHDARVSSQ